MDKTENYLSYHLGNGKQCIEQLTQAWEQMVWYCICDDHCWILKSSKIESVQMRSVQNSFPSFIKAVWLDGLIDVTVCYIHVAFSAVVIIPILKRLLKYDCVILVKQYRPPVKGYTLEFPAGMMNAKFFTLFAIIFSKFLNLYCLSWENWPRMHTFKLFVFFFCCSKNIFCIFITFRIKYSVIFKC